MTGIIITGHGSFASGLSANVKLLAGNQTELTALDFTDQKTPEQLEKELAAAIETYGRSSVIIILTDIMGGTPYMKAAALSVKNVPAGTGKRALPESIGLSRPFSSHTLKPSSKATISK